jgi:hypothetical protein
MPFSYKEWYEKNKSTLSQKRAEKYRADPEYRSKALRRSKEQRSRRVPLPPPPDGGYTIAFVDAAKDIGISHWTLRDWRTRNYFPEPKKRLGKLWFNQQQLALLHMLKGFFDAYSNKDKEGLENMKATIYANW